MTSRPRKVGEDGCVRSDVVCLLVAGSVVVPDLPIPAPGHVGGTSFYSQVRPVGLEQR